MLLKVILIFALVSSPALGSAVKGYSDSGVKGGQRLVAVERRQEATKTIEQRQSEHHAQATKTTSLHQERQIETSGKTSAASAETQQHELTEQRQLQATKGGERAEQKRDDLQAEQQQQLQQPQQQAVQLQAERVEVQREENTQQRLESVKEEQPSAKGHYEAKQQVRLEEAKGGRAELAASSQKRLEQTQQLAYEQQQQQQVELTKDLYEQRQTEEQQHYELVQQKEEVKGATKGGQAYQQQPLAEAEPYAFDYSVEGSSRSESGDSRGVVRGQYTLQNPDGSTRVVDYVADHNGFRAIVNTNEFGTESRSPANIELRSTQPAAEDISLRLEGKTRESLEQAAPTKGAPAAPEPQLPRRPDNWSIKQEPISLAPPPPPPAALAPLVVAAPPPQLIAEEQPPRAIRGKTVEELSAPLFSEQQRLEADKDLGQQQLISQKQELAQEKAQASSKGELRAPKAIESAPRKALERAQVGQLRASGFESATAHRVAAPIGHPVPPVTVHRLRSVPRPEVVVPVAPVHNRQYLQPARSRSQYDRRPSAPLNQLVRSREPAARVSFYAAGGNSESLDDSPASFEHQPFE